jgi:hypothetical protein
MSDSPNPQVILIASTFWNRPPGRGRSVTRFGFVADQSHQESQCPVDRLDLSTRTITPISTGTTMHSEEPEYRANAEAHDQNDFYPSGTETVHTISLGSFHYITAWTGRKWVFPSFPELLVSEGHAIAFLYGSPGCFGRNDLKPYLTSSVFRASNMTPKVIKHVVVAQERHSV